MATEKRCLQFSFGGGLPITTDGFHVWERESSVRSPPSMKGILLSPFSFFEQGLLPVCHGFCSFHRFRCDRRFPNLPLVEFFQGGLHLLDLVIRRDHPFLRGIELHALFFAVFIVAVLNINHLVALEIRDSSFCLWTFVRGRLDTENKRKRMFLPMRALGRVRAPGTEEGG
ncbi:hypothetical protein PIB30_008214 [Stylosanthes scabra]|uniref:Uncharacterized protein n=1 Tax=Stylosanthes scabra TaxID=79078 RepID=A0ABU6Q5M8_9FABA|nr:hypothetical protein [Stylosanthes scabra]